MKENRFKLIIGLLLISVGICAASYPWVQARYFDYRQEKLVKTWDANTLDISISVGSQIPVSTVQPVHRDAPVMYDDDNILVENVQPSFDLNSVLPYMIGMITIEAINLRSPLLNGDDIRNLDLGICALQGSPPIGGEGNVCVAGHKSRIRGRHFSRLNELTGGESVLITDGLRTYQYEVYEIIKVTADDVWILENIANDSILTMITCDYTQNPIGRLAVRARLVADSPL